MQKQVCVIGLGRFGATIATELYQLGHDVLAIDADETRIQDMLGLVTYAVRADATQESVLRELGVGDMDVAVVALGSENIQASILITVLLKSLGIPFITARAVTELHGDTLERIGADKVVYPEMESARRVAHVDFNPGMMDYMELAANAGIGKIRPPEEIVGRTLEEAGFGTPDGKLGVFVLALRRGRSYIVNPARDEQIKPGDVLIVAGRNEHIGRVNTLPREQGSMTSGGIGRNR